MPSDGCAQMVCVGAVAGAHGVRGVVRVKSFTAEPDDVCAYGPVSDETGTRFWRIERVGHAKGVVLVRLEGVSDRDAADALKGTRLYVARSALPEPEDEEEFYHADLIGLSAELADGTPFGRVKAVHDHGAGDILEIARPHAPPLDVPFTLAAVPLVDVAGGRIVIDLPPGLTGPVAVDGEGAAGEAAEEGSEDGPEEESGDVGDERRG